MQPSPRRQKEDMAVQYKKFDDVAAKKIGYYVYALRDPRDGVVFYVGKGVGNRWHAHIIDARKKNNDETLKLARIRDIEASGHQVDAFVIRHGIESEKVAYEVEASVVHMLRLLEKSGHSAGIDLTNIAETHHPERGLADVRLAQTLYNAPRAPEIEVPCALFKVSQLWYPDMADEELRQAVLGWWTARNVLKRKDKAQYAFAVSRQIIRGVYRIEPSMWRERRRGDRGWHKDDAKSPRWGFPECVSAPEMSDFLNTSVAHLYKRGDANVVRFLHCD